MEFLMPNNNRYEISEALQMPLPLTKEEAMQETLTQKESAARRFPILPSNANVTVIPIIPGITLFGYIRFLNASPVETRVDIYANGRKVAAVCISMLLRIYEAVSGWYRIYDLPRRNRHKPSDVLRLQVQSGGIYTVAVTGLADALSTLTIEDSHRYLSPNRAYIRCEAAPPDCPAMDVYWDDRMVLSDLRYEEISRYLTTAPGSHNLKLRETDTGKILVEHPKVNLKGGKAYTVYVVGSRADRAGLQVLIPLEGVTYLDTSENYRIYGFFLKTPVQMDYPLLYYCQYLSLKNHDKFQYNQTRRIIMLKGKLLFSGVGSIAAYKMANVASMLVKLHADVHVIMTENACQFITPVTFETLTGNKCMVDTFDRNFSSMWHIFPLRKGGCASGCACFRKCDWQAGKRHCG